MRPYLDLLRHVLEHGDEKSDRTGTGTRSVFGWQMRFDLNEGFPLVTTKKLHTRSIIHELLWFLQGSTNIAYLKDNKVSIWDEWADADGELGPVYGKQWRSWEGADGKLSCQLYQRSGDIFLGVPFNIASYALLTHMVAQVCGLQVGDFVHTLGDAHLYSNHYEQAREQLARSPRALPTLKLNPDVTDGRLSCQVYQRSADMFLGVPFNIASYALLTHMVAQVCGLGVGDFVHTLGDAHLYSNHFEQAREQLSREPRPLPKLVLNPAIDDLFAFRFEDIAIEGYAPHAAIKAPVAV